MSAIDQYLEDDASDLVFGYRTFLVPGRKVEIGYSVRKKSAFPLVEELILKILIVVEGASLEELVAFLDLAAKEIQDVIRPLLRKGLIILIGEEFHLSEVGKCLFASSEDGTPSITESESRSNSFVVDDSCGLPVEVRNLSEHVAKGSLRWLISDLRVKSHENETVTARVVRNFSEYFAHFVRSEVELEKIRDEQLHLHKTEYSKTKASFLVQTDVQGVMRNNGEVENQVLPFDSLKPRTESRQRLRELAIEGARVPLDGRFAGEVNFLRNLFGQDFLEGYAQAGSMAWSKIAPIFFNGTGSLPRLKSGDGLVIGEACVPRNLLLIERIFQTLSSKTEISPDRPLRIAWLRPSVASWGRSIGFLEGIKALREITRELPKGCAEIELWANWYGDAEKLEPQLRSFWPWFDEVRVFRSPQIPLKVEMLLIGDSDGLMLTHAFTPPQACFPCPLGICFEGNESVQRLVASEIEPKLRSLPEPQKPSKNPTKKAKARDGIRS